MYQLMYRDPSREGAWMVVSKRESLEEIKEIWDSIFWSVCSQAKIGYGGLVDFLKIENLVER